MKTIALAALIAGAGLCASAHADFTGPTAPANWTIISSGTLIGASATLGSAVFSPTQLVLSGSTANDPGCAGSASGFWARAGRRRPSPGAAPSASSSPI